MSDDDFFNKANIQNIVSKYYNFVKSCTKDNIDYSLTVKDNNSPYARCFAIFGLNLIGKKNVIFEKKDILHKKIIEDLNNFKIGREKVNINLLFDKAYLQLLCFSLSFDSFQTH